jgi:phenylpyruvate tautomerase PptA (4-oxalocrotonate tautomerase family)
MIDVYATPGTFADPAGLATTLAATLMEVEGVPPIALFRENTAAFVHDTILNDVNGSHDHVRVQVLTNAGALDRDKQLAAVSRLTEVVGEYAKDPTVTKRTWVLLTEAIPGGWGIAGHANTNENIVDLARAELAHRALG